MADSIFNCKDIKNADVVIVGANYDRTSSFGKGSSKGPDAIKQCLDKQIEFYDRYSKKITKDNTQIFYKDIKGLNLIKPEKMVEVLEKECSNFSGKFLLMLGGEHSITNGSLLAISKTINPESVTIVQLDAHLDMRDTDEDYNDKPWGKYAHSCVMRRAVELGFKTINIGARAYDSEELAFAKKSKSKIFEWGLDLKEAEISEILKEIKTENVYLTIDVDGFDPSCMPATGTPVNGGFSWVYGNNLLKKICETKKIIGADIVEVAPVKNNNLTEYSAAQLAYNLISWIQENNLKRLILFNARS